jgi:hypothetical protein
MQRELDWEKLIAVFGRPCASCWRFGWAGRDSMAGYSKPSGKSRKEPPANEEPTMKVLLVALMFAISLPQSGAAQRPAQSITIGSIELRLNMRRDQVLSALAPHYTIQDGLIRSQSGPPYAFVGSVRFSETGLLTYVSREWTPTDQWEGVPTAEGLYGALSQITQSSHKLRDNTTVQVCNCTVFVYTTFSSGGEVKHIDVFDGEKTVALLVVRNTALGGPFLMMHEHIETAR